MKINFRKQVLKIGILFFLVTALVVSIAVPSLAATTTTAMHTLQGKVLSTDTAGSSFVIQNGTQAQVTVTVDPNTRYYVVSMGRADAYVTNQVTKDIKQDKGKQTRAGAMKELHIPANWRSNLDWLETFDTQGKFADIQVGDRIVARVTSNNLAAQVLITKAPVIQTIKGNVSGVTTNTVTISPPNNGAAVTLNINSNTHVTLKGFVSVQVGQIATAVYNRITLIAQTISVVPATTPAPVNPPTTTAGIATKLAFVSQPAGAVAGAAFTGQPVVTVQDANGNTLTGSTVPVTLAITSGTSGAVLSGTATVNAVNGIATFSGLSINLVGSYTLSASSTGLTSATSTAFAVTPGVASKLVFTTQPVGAKAGNALATQPVVTVQDASGNIISGSNASITLAIGTNPGNGTLSGTNPVSAVNGVATFSGLTISTAGTGYILTASSSGLAPANSNVFDMTAQ